ncbi:MAG: SpoIID/LytB domain-containing protein [Candidatus Roizmanbacteria bacterium]
MKKKLLIFFLTLLILIPLCVKADELEDITSQLEVLKRDLSSKEANHQQLTIKLNDLKNRVALLDNQIVKKEKEVKKGEEALVYQKNLLNVRAKSYYKNISKSSLGIIDIMVGENLSESLRKFFYQKSLVDDDKRTIIKVVIYIKNLEEIKKNLEEEKTKTAYLKQEIDNQAKILSSQIGQTRSEIASLSARQQQLIATKQASLGISRSASSLGRCDSDLTNGRDPGFSPKFAFFTYGVPNRIGMNQYGAWGRAKAGKNETEILQAYYNYDEIKKWDTNIDIRVDGLGTYKLEDYIKRIYEIPDSWTDNNLAALKAQAIAARSYVLAYTNNGQGSICATENCQVAKSEPKGGNWEQAVNQTEGQVMVQGGSPIKAWFSSTHGGYVFSSGEIGWSGTSWTKHSNDFDGSINNFSDLTSRAYDRESPWFYCDWGSRSEFNKTAWLKPQDLADIINIILLVKNDSSIRDHLYQVDKSNPAGTDTWDFERVKSELRNRGIASFSSINDGSVNADFGSGRTTAVNFSGDGGNISFSASEFKDWFNLRAPANIQIVGPLFNIEKR